MLSTLIKSEWIKLKNQKILTVSFCLLFIFQALTVFVLNKRPHVEDNLAFVHELRSLQETLDSSQYPADMAATLLDKYQEEENDLQDLSNYLLSQTIPDYQSDEPELNTKQLKLLTKYSTTELITKRLQGYVQPMIDRLKYMVNFKNFLEDRQNEIDNKLSISLYSNPSSFAYKTLMRQKSAWQALSEVELSLGLEKGISIVQDVALTDIFFLLFMMISLASIFLRDHELHINQLLASYSCSRQKLITARLILSSLVIFISAALYYIFQIGFIAAIAHFGDLNRTIQSLAIFRMSGFVISLKEFLLLYLGTKIISCLAIALFFTLLMVFLREARLVNLLVLFILFLSYVGFHEISALSSWQLVKYFNVFGLLDNFGQIAIYNDINCFSLPVNRLLGSLVFDLFLVTISFSLIALKGKKVYLEDPSFSLRLPFQPWKKFALKNLNMIELWRLFYKRAGLLILLLLFLFSAKTIQKKEDIHPSKDRLFYLDYYKQVQGVFNLNTLRKMDNFRQEFIDLEKEELELAQKIEASEIDETTRIIAEEKIRQKREKRYSFDKLDRQIQTLASFSKEKNPLYVIDEQISEYWFNNPRKNALLGSISAVATYIFSVALLEEDQRNHILSLLKTYPLGHSSLFWKRMLYQFIFSVSIFVILFGGQYLEAKQLAYMPEWHAAIHSLTAFTDSHLTISIAETFVLLIAYSLLALFLQAILNFYLMQKIKNIWAVSSLSFLFFVLPNLALLYSPEVNIIKTLAPGNAFTIFAFLPSLQKLGLILIFPCLISAIVIISYLSYSNWRKDCLFG